MRKHLKPLSNSNTTRSKCSRRQYNTPIKATSNVITVNDKTLDTPVQLELNKIQVFERTTSNTISVNQNTIDTPVNISNNRLIVDEETIDIVANAFSNNISVCENNIDSPVIIENNSIQVLENWIETEFSLRTTLLHSQLIFLAVNLQINEQKSYCLLKFIYNNFYDK